MFWRGVQYFFGGAVAGHRCCWTVHACSRCCLAVLCCAALRCAVRFHCCCRRCCRRCVLQGVCQRVQTCRRHERLHHQVGAGFAFGHATAAQPSPGVCSTVAAYPSRSLLLTGAMSVFTTKSLLASLGVSNKRTGEAAAAINWVVKDGAGRLGRFLFARW